MIEAPHDSHLRWLLVVAVAVIIGTARADLNQDKTECADKLVGLATCLPYVAGDEKTPSIDCCSGMKQVLDKSKRCICVLIKDRNDPNLGIKFNATLALSLPDACHSPTNITQCIDLLQLDPKSKEAEIFTGSSLKGNSSSAPSASETASPPATNASSSASNGTSSDTQNGSSGRKMNMELLVSVVASGALVWWFTSNLMLYA